jgi:hypothetical protein
LALDRTAIDLSEKHPCSDANPAKRENHEPHELKHGFGVFACQFSLGALANSAFKDYGDLLPEPFFLLHPTVAKMFHIASP